MITKINRQIALNKYPAFPTRGYDMVNDEDIFHYPKVHSTIILTLNSKSFRGHINTLATEIINFVKQLDSQYLVFLGDTKTAWLSQKNEYRPANEARQFLVDNNVGQRFNGALQVDGDTLKAFIKHLAWLIRSNAALPYIYFTDKGQNIICTICQYGNLHVSSLNDKTSLLIKRILTTSKLKLLKGATCSNQFGSTSKIIGRQSVV